MKCLDEYPVNSRYYVSVKIKFHVAVDCTCPLEFDVVRWSDSESGEGAVG